MPRESPPRRTDVRRQIIIGLKLSGLALGLTLCLFWCLGDTFRRWTLHQPQFEALEPQRLSLVVSCLAAGNLDGNAWDDLVISSTLGGAQRLVALLGTAEGPSLTEPLDVPEPFGVSDLVLADLDGDGLDEIIGAPSGEQAEGIGIWWNEGGLRLRRVGVRAPLRYVDVADEDRDGHPDLIGVTRAWDEIRAYRVAGREVILDPAFKSDLYDNTVRDLEAAHLDRGGVDVAMVARDRLRLFRSGGLLPDPTSHFNLPVRSFRLERASVATPSLVLDDLNGDGRPDLATLESGSVWLRLGLGGGNFVEARYPVASQPAQRLIAGDFDGDGRPDLMAVGQDAQTLQRLMCRR